MARNRRLPEPECSRKPILRFPCPLSRGVGHGLPNAIPVAGHSTITPTARLAAGLQPNSSTFDGNPIPRPYLSPPARQSLGRPQPQPPRQPVDPRKRRFFRSQRSRRRNRSGNRSGQSSKSPEQTTVQKILSILTFGLLGKPAPRQSQKPARKPESSRPAPSTKAPAARTTPDESRGKRNATAPRSPRADSMWANLDYSTGEAETHGPFQGRRQRHSRGSRDESPDPAVEGFCLCLKWVPSTRPNGP